MGLLKRMTTALSSNINAALDDVEDTTKVMDQALADMEDGLRKARQQQVEATAAAKLAEKQLQAAVARARELEAKATEAVKAGRDDLARAALERKAAVDAEVEEAQRLAQGHQESLAQLAAGVAALTDKVTETRHRRDKLAARLEVAEAKRRREAALQATATGALEDPSTLDEFERLRDRIDQDEALADAQRELDGPGTAVDDTAQRKALEKATAEDALATLKRKMGMG